jgi:hypothetical protein
MSPLSAPLRINDGTKRGSWDSTEPMTTSDCGAAGTLRQRREKKEGYLFSYPLPSSRRLGRLSMK